MFHVLFSDEASSDRVDLTIPVKSTPSPQSVSLGGPVGLVCCGWTYLPCSFMFGFVHAWFVVISTLFSASLFGWIVL